MRAFLSSAFEHFLSFLCIDQLALTYDSTLYLHALMASTSGLTSDLTSPVSGGVSLSMSFSVQRLTENHLSAASIAASGVRSPAVVLAILSRSTLAHGARGAHHGIPPRHPPSPETNLCESSDLEPQEESCASCSRALGMELWQPQGC